MLQGQRKLCILDWETNPWLRDCDPIFIIWISVVCFHRFGQTCTTAQLILNSQSGFPIPVHFEDNMNPVIYAYHFVYV
jgi:hypothetical protein